jgi:uncharacterized iron-regulated protein
MNHSSVLTRLLGTGCTRALLLLSLGFAAGLTTMAIEGHAERQEQGCVPVGAWVVPGRGSIASEQLFSNLVASRVVLLGERHDRQEDHRWQLQVLAALHARRPDLVIGFEMFPRRVQPALDKWVAGELTEKQFLESSDWKQVWNLPAEIYLPLFQFARINRIPMIALNVDEKLTKAITAKGLDAVPEAEREGVGRPAAPPEDYRDFLFEIYQHHQTMKGKDGDKAEKTDKAFGYFVESQTTWDRAMAEALARAARAAGTPNAGTPPLVVGIMGSGHIRHGHGVPHQLRALGVKDIGTLLPVEADFDCREIKPGLADALFAVPEQAVAKPDPPRLGVQLDGNDGGVRIVQVTAGSLAERTGFKSGDRLIEVAGTPAKKVSPVIAAIRAQPHGTWLPMKVARGDETLDIVVKFPAQP